MYSFRSIDDRKAMDVDSVNDVMHRKECFEKVIVTGRDERCFSKTPVNNSIVFYPMLRCRKELFYRYSDTLGSRTKVVLFCVCWSWS